MPNVFYRAKSLWESGKTREGFALLDAHLRGRLEREVFAEPTHLLDGDPGFFETGVAIMLSSTLTMSAETLLKAPLCRVLPELHALDPNQEWIDVLVGYDFFAAPSSGAIDVEEHAPPANDDGDFRALVAALGAAAEKGELGGDARNAQFGGRPVLPLAQLRAVEDARWGALKPMLHARLEKAYAECPADFWARLVAEDPTRVATRFLHHLVGRAHSPPSRMESLWALIGERAPEYAAGSRAALATLLERATSEELTEIAHIDAGKREVADGGAWLRALAAALDGGSFAAL